MRSYYSDKKVCFRIRVSFENMERMKPHIDTSYVPLFALKKDKYYSLRFEYKIFTCSHQGKKQEFSYNDIKRVETQADGLIIYLTNGAYLSISTEKSENHNTELYDIVKFLKKYCRKAFFEIEEISYPEDETSRYQAKEEPISKISFVLSDKEISKLLWYDYLIDERMLIFVVLTAISLLIAVIIKNIVFFAVFAVIITIPSVSPTVMFWRNTEGYVKNHRGELYALMYDDLLVIRLRDTDLELEYATMKRLKSFFGLWRMRSGDFFVLTLPKRIVMDNISFFDQLDKKVK